jgi:hypothetical protein
MLSKRFTTMVLAGAAAAGLAGTANAAMVIGLEAFLKNGAPLAGPDTPHLVNVAVGDVVSFRAYADVTQVGTTGVPVFSSAGGKMLSQGPLEGNFGALSHLTQLSTAGGSGAQGGDENDLDGDGDLDLGGTSPASTTGWILYRSNQPGGTSGPRSTTSQGTVGGTANVYDAGYEPQPIAGGFRYWLTEQVDFTVTDATGQANVVWAYREQAGNATWFENATEILTPKAGGKTQVTYSGGQTGTAFTAGQPVQLIGGTIPEPASLGLAALAGLGLLARRRNG